MHIMHTGKRLAIRHWRAIFYYYTKCYIIASRDLTVKIFYREPNSVKSRNVANKPSVIPHVCIYRDGRRFHHILIGVFFIEP